MNQIGNSLVAVDKVNNIKSEEQISHVLNKILDYCKPLIKVPRDATIIIKVNLCLLIGPETGGTVDPIVAKLLCRWFLQHYDINKIYLAEADATHLNADIAFKALGWRKLFKTWELDVEFLNLSSDKRVQAKTYAGQIFEMSEKYMKADVLISLAKLKTHTKQKITCTMKNLFGALPEKFKVKYHPCLTETICEIASARKPDLSLVDGLIAMNGKGPTNGFPKICGLLIAGNDMVATDHFCAKLMGFHPRSVPHISKAIKVGLGSSKYNVIGDSLIERGLKFRVMPPWEKQFRRLVRAFGQKGDSITV